MNEPSTERRSGPSGPEPHEPAAEPREPATLPIEPGAGMRTGGSPGRTAVLGLAALAVAVAFGAGILVGRMTVPGAAAVASPSAEPGASPSPDAIAGLPSEGSRLGRADAKVVIDYWADYQCPYCAKFAQDVIPQLVSRIADGTVALVHRDYAFLGPESVDAAIAVRCAERQGRFWPMHDAVYAAQVGENQGAFARSRLEVVAASVGLDATAFSACLDEREPLVEVLDDTAAGVRAGVSSTPTIDVNGTRFAGVSDVPGLLKAIDAAVAGASPAPLPTAQPPQDPWAALPTRGREAGNAAAPVTVELWMDYQATASATIANQLEPELRTRVGKGAIRVVQRDLATLGDESVLAAAAARCVASQGGPAWLTNDVLSVSARGQGQGIYTPVSLLRFASRLGLDVRAMSDCLDDPAVSADVRAETAMGTAGGLTSAPAVVVLAGTKEVARFTGELDVTKILAVIDGAR